MPVFLDTRGEPTLGIGICQRCQRKFPLADLLDDPNIKDLKVCKDDRDQFDPYRLPARQPENIKLPFNRPDVDVAIDPSGIISQNEDNFLVTEDVDGYLTT